MNRKRLIACLGLAGLTAALSAQAPSPSGTVGQKTIQSIRAHVIGCVAADGEAGSLPPHNAVLSGDDVPSPPGRRGR